MEFPNSRICEVHLQGDKTFKLRQKVYRVSDSLKTGDASTLFGANSNGLKLHFRSF